MRLLTESLVLFQILHCTIGDKTSGYSSKGEELRDKSHIIKTLNLDHSSFTEQIARDHRVEEALKKLTNIFHNSIRPIEELYRFKDLGQHNMKDAQITAEPLILFVGPWSTGKSTMINYIAGIENHNHLLHTGAEPTTSDFTVVTGGQRYKTVEGLVLATDPSRQFSPLEKFGQGFLERFQGVEMPYSLLHKVMLVDTPGIIENRKQQERGYPFNDVMKWFIDRADLIIIVFDPSKLDVGTELESLFHQLKGRESQIRIVLNKADSVATQELMRVYGALFWNLAPLINVTEPPRVYTGSFWEHSFKEGTNHDLFLLEEISLLRDINEVVSNLVENKIAMVRQHAYRVRIHALLVHHYLIAFTSRQSIFGDAELLLHDIVDHPGRYNIYQSLLADEYISKYDMPSQDVYKDFFSVNALNMFKPATSHCSYISGCAMDHLLESITTTLPNLLTEFKESMMQASQCTADGPC